jgi:hypothetical protein
MHHLAHIQNTYSQYNLPEICKQLAYKANRDGGADRFPDSAVQIALLEIHALGSTKSHAASLRHFPSRAGTLTDQLALKLGYPREHRQDEFTS